jgi:hypothetical protein
LQEALDSIPSTTRKKTLKEKRVEKPKNRPKDISTDP